MNKPKNVLILEKEAKVVKALGEALNTQGFSTFATYNVTSALRKTDNQRYNVIVVDTSVGSAKIVEFLKTISLAGSLNKNTPIMVSSDDPSFELPLNLIKRISRILPKPYTLADAIGNINDLVAS